MKAHIIHVFPGFYQYKAGALKCLAQGRSQENLEDPLQPEPRTPGSNTLPLSHAAPGINLEYHTVQCLTSPYLSEVQVV